MTDHQDAGDGHEAAQFDQAFWDERYRSHHSLWSGEPNRHLVSETGGLTPGTALDAGCGEGADAIWLAQRGWRVTAVDLSPVALERAATRAREAGEEVARRIEWAQEDLTTWEPEPGRYDLVAAHYLHLQREPREALFRRLASAVAAGGTLLIVGHHPSDRQTTVRRPRSEEVYFTGDDLASTLDSHTWVVVTNAAREGTATDTVDRQVTVHDTVFRALRRL